LKSIISLKADKVDLEEIRVIKSNKQETDLSWNFIEKIHSQLANSAVILKELLKLQAPVYPLSENEKSSKISYL
jgi:hypothetical protein